MPRMHAHLHRLMYHFGYKPCVSEVTLTKEEEAVPYPPRVGNLRPPKISCKFQSVS